MTEKLALSESTFSSGANLAYLGTVAKLAIISFLPILLRFSESSVSPNATIFNRFWIATALLGLWHGGLLLKRRSADNLSPIALFPDIHSFLLLIVLAIFCASYQLMWAWSLTQTSVANSEVMHSLAPIFTTLIGWSLFGQQFDRIFLLGIAVAVIGSVSLAANDFSIAIEKLQGDGLALLSASFWAVSLLVAEKLQTRLSILAITTWNSLLVTVFLIPIFLVIQDPIFPHSFEGWFNVSLLGILVIINQVLTVYVFKWLSSGLVATILLLTPILTAIFGWFIFSEHLNLLNWLALSIVLLGIYLTTLSKKAIKT